MPAFFGIGSGRSTVLPENIQVRFQGRRCTGKPTDDPTIPQWYLSTVALSSLTLAVPAVGQGNPVGKGKAVLKDTALALFNVTVADPTNKSTLDTLAMQIAQDMVNWQSIEFDQTYNGIIAPPPNGILDLVEWTLRTDNVQTRLWTSPYNSAPEEFQHNDGPHNILCIDVTGAGSQNATVSQAPCVAYYGPLAVCASGSLRMPRFKVCLEDGRLYSRYIQTDTINVSG